MTGVPSARTAMPSTATEPTGAMAGSVTSYGSPEKTMLSTVTSSTSFVSSW